MERPTAITKRPLELEESAEDSSGGATPATLTNRISPPPMVKKRRLSKSHEIENGTDITVPSRQIISSPFHLTKINDLPPELNHDTVTLKDLLGDPLIAECWQFNYLHDIDFLIAAFDDDVRHLVKVHVVHGFWKSEDANKKELEDQASRHKNVKLHSAYLPDMFGTHHTKMMILLRHDDTAQIIIHTANMIVRDWTNMTQAVWRSPCLPLLPSPAPAEPTSTQLGTGARFRIDFLNYIRAYDANRKYKNFQGIVSRLSKYDFSAIRGVLIGSVPGRHDADVPTQWGWPALKEALRSVPVSTTTTDGKDKPTIAIQISSIATLGPTDKWLRDTFFPTLAGKGGKKDVDFKIIFPTAEEIRRSLDGYVSGGSIHTKIQSAQQKKQLEYLRPLFCHWGNDSAEGKELGEGTVVKEAGRKRAAPHIKTYVRYAGEEGERIDWALITSANLSKQAWGDARGNNGDVRIASYELGVLVWPGLWGEDAVMKGSFLRDTVADDEEGIVVSFRMPYNLPLQPYAKHEVPWVATADHTEPDWKGQIWQHR
ncbi:putative tyrosyl-DNA phosphodiesterase [Podospora aff. communis PSN243]|uniref:Tyrosyl-DNA phosphodiesterase n=1 Tax=Podospora aff. communis PSN243 TaxID=3040156 RepID=A0AAV9GPP1_9PEZI|nr:putative tyrosyl-DNA phosphodiesterase [Podospora aff. communis PSN243]